jgi:hypothetical protein
MHREGRSHGKGDQRGCSEILCGEMCSSHQQLRWGLSVEIMQGGSRQAGIGKRQAGSRFDNFKLCRLQSEKILACKQLAINHLHKQIIYIYLV